MQSFQKVIRHQEAGDLLHGTPTSGHYQSIHLHDELQEDALEGCRHQYGSKDKHPSEGARNE